nr:Stk1 family PASTA domain-containing Ser/Thr kinase [Maliibacterium massiliense]
MKGRIIGSRYEILNKVGSGGMADVYRARDNRTRGVVAIKIMHADLMSDSEFVRRFAREAQAQSMLDHPNIVRTLDYGQDDGMPYIVMEYVRGITLKEFIVKKAPLSQQVLTDIAMQILRALAHAHARGLVHRDIKPQNMLINREGMVKVVDFGLAKAASSATITLTGSNVLGSVHYFSPEQARGVASDERSDLYSLGIILYEMATGALPYDGDTPVTVALKHLQDAPLWPHALAPVAPALEDVILKAMMKEPEERYQSAEEMAGDLKAALEHPAAHFVDFPEDAIIAVDESEQQEAPEPPEESSVPPWRAVRMALGGIALILLFAALLALGWMLYRESSSTVRDLPNFAGMVQEEAQNAVRALNLRPETIQQADDNVSVGKVIAQSPEAGSDIKQDEVVRLYVSTGPATMEMPSLKGKNITEAERMLHEMGLAVGEINYTVTSKEKKDTVVDQLPRVGSTVEKGDKIDLWLARP